MEEKTEEKEKSPFVPDVPNISYVLAPGEKLQICPYDSGHHVREQRMGYHIPKCRRNYEKIHGPQETRRCRYGHGLKDIPLMEIHHHEEFCCNKDMPMWPESDSEGVRKVIEEIKASISARKEERKHVDDDEELWESDPTRPNFVYCPEKAWNYVPYNMAPADRKAWRKARRLDFCVDPEYYKELKNNASGGDELHESLHETEPKDVEPNVSSIKKVDNDNDDLAFFNDNPEEEELQLTGEEYQCGRQNKDLEKVTAEGEGEQGSAMVPEVDGGKDVAGSSVADDHLDVSDKTEEGNVKQGNNGPQFEDIGDYVETDDEDDDFFDAMSSVSMGPYVPK